jgi:hypothetical protein
MAARYVPTASEIEAFNRDLTRYSRAAEAEGDTFTAADLRMLAQVHWPGRNVLIGAPTLGIERVESNPESTPSPPQQPAAATQGTGTPPEAPKPPDPLAGLPAHERQRLEHAAAVLADHPYGRMQPTVVDGGRHQAGDAGVEYDGRGRILSGPRTLADDDAQAARDALAAVPQYGQPGWEQGKQKALAVLANARQRAPLSPDKAAKLAQAEAALEVEARAAFRAELAEKQARGELVANYRELGALAEKHGVTL